MQLHLREITEGKTKLLVPDLEKYKRKEDAPVFYNPVFSADRDIAVAVLQNFFKKKAAVADILCGLGARGVRYANECSFDVTLNDVSPTAVELAKQNAEINNVEVKTSVNEANRFLINNEDKFDCIEIDPFGSPALFVESALRAIQPKGSMLCISATDLGTLAGFYPKACFRKYGIVSSDTSFKHELGVRNLLAYIAFQAMKREYSVQPVLCYSHEHYYRVYAEIISGRKTVNRDLVNIGFILYCSKCDNRKYAPLYHEIEEKCSCGNKFMLLGSTWISKLGDADFLAKNQVLTRYALESDFKMPYIDLHSFAKKHKADVASTSGAIDLLRKNGFRAEKTHFCGHAVKTNADFEEVKNILKK